MFTFVTVLLETYAMVLAWLHSLSGVQTDEAKYLLNIPYPHPPLVRSILGFADGWPMQEMFWRVIFASLLIQSVWFLWGMTRGMQSTTRLFACSLWLLSPSLFLQAGTVMLAPITALQGLLFLWLLHRQRQGSDVLPETTGFLWAVTLLTAYQGVLFLPLVIALLRRMHAPRWRRLLSLVLPLLLLALVTMRNPLAIATMLIHRSDGAAVSFLEHLQGTVQLWFMAGAGIVSILGVIGILLSRRWELVATFLLVALFILESVPYPFYAILFVPLLIEGMREVFLLFDGTKVIAGVAILLVLGWLLLKPWNSIDTKPSLARETFLAIAQKIHEGSVAIAGPFGHQWQYESMHPIERYRPEHTEDIVAIICLEQCQAPAGEEWRRLPELPIPVWVRAP